MKSPEGFIWISHNTIIKTHISWLKTWNFSCKKNLYLSGLEKDHACLVARSTNQFKELFHYDIEDSQFDLLVINNKQITKHSHDLWQI